MGPPNQEQVDIAAALNEALRETSGIFEDIADKTKSTSERLNEALRNLQDLNRESENQRRVNDDLNRSLEEGNRQNQEQERLLKWLPDGWKKYGKQTEKAARTTATMTAAIQGLRNGMEMTKAAFNVLGGAMNALVGIAKGTLGLFTGIVGGLFAAAAQYFNNSSGEIFQAMESIRAEFGNLRGPIGGMVVGFKHELADASNALAAAGTSLYGVLGNSAQRLEAVKEIASGFGDTLVRLKDQVKGNVGALVIMQKGMGLTGDAMKTMAINAEANGEQMTDSLNKTMITSAYMAKKFGLDVKQIGKGFNEMMVDTQNFGDLAPEVMVATATYATKLGISIKDLQGIMGKFDEFEAAAQSAGMLAEAFGMNVDAMNMMMEDNPAKRVDMIRQAFEDTGRSVEDLNRRELKLMADQAGLDVNAMKNALSMSVDEMGFDDFEDAMGEAEEQMSLEDSMATVAKSIQKVMRTMKQMADGPLGNLINGFIYGMEMSAEWREIMRTLGDYLKIFYYEGIKLGQLFADQLGKMGFVRENIEKFLNFEGLRAMFTDIQGTLKDFFAALSSNPEKAGREFIEKIWTSIVDYIGTIGSQTATTAFGGVVENLINSLAGMAPALIEKVSGIIQTVADFIGGNGVQATIGTAAQSGIATALTNAFDSIWTSLRETLVPALMSLLGSVWDQVKAPLITMLVGIWTFVLMKSIATALVQQAVITLIKGGVTSLIGGAAAGSAAANTAAGAAGGNPVVAANAGATLTALITSVTAITPMQILEFSVKLAAMALSMLPAMAIFAAGVGLMAKAYQEAGIGVSDVIAVMAAVGISLAAVWGLSKVADTIDPKLIFASLKGVGAAAVFIVAVGAYAALLNLAITLSGGSNFFETLGWFAGIGLAFIASLELAAIAVGLASAFWGPQGLMAVGGVIMAGAFVALLGVFAFALQETITRANLDILPALAFMGAMILISVGLLPVITAFALMGSVGLLAIPLAMVGLGMAHWFVSEGLIPFAQATITDLQSMNIDTKKLIEAIAGIGLTIVAIGQMLVTIMAAGALAMIPGATLVAAVGIAAFGTFALISLPIMATIIDGISSIDIGDPEVFKAKVDGLGKLILAISSIASLGIEAGRLAVVGSLFGAPDIPSMFNMMEGFITGTLDSIKTVIVKFAELATGMSSETLAGMGAIADLIAGIARFGTSMLGPIQEVKKGQNFWNSASDYQEDLTAMVQGMEGILGSIVTFLPGLVRKLVAVLKDQEFPEGLDKKAETLGSIFSAVSSMTDAVIKMHTVAEENKGWFSNKSVAQTMQEMFHQIKSVFEGDTVTGMVNSVISAIDGITPIGEDKMKSTIDSINKTMKLTKDLSAFGDYMMKDGLKGLNQLQEAWKIIGLGESDPLGNYLTYDQLSPAGAIAVIAEEAKKIAEEMENMDVDLGKIAMKPLLNGMLKNKGGEITIKPGNVHIHVKFDVHMDAKELAVAMHHSGEKEYEDGYFKLSEAAKQDDAFAEAQ